MLYKTFRWCVRKTLPKYIYSFIHQLVDSFIRKRLASKMSIKHRQYLNQLKGKKKIKVVFIALEKSTWKVDSVFKKMLKDDFFDPIILVCPIRSLPPELIISFMEQCYQYFKNKNYPVTSAYNKKTKTWVSLDSLKPDLVFFTNPHKITRSEYYEAAFKNYLSCYVPYSYDVSNYDDNIPQYDQLFHNAIWKIFTPHKCSENTFKTTCRGMKGENTHLTGYPFCEQFYNLSSNSEVWKKQGIEKKKVIWAPHHTIAISSLPYSSFLKIADAMKDLSNKYKDTIQFSFKPHPLLKSRLYEHAEWGRDKTLSYYNYWTSTSNTQLEEGEYADLFIHSDALVHDSGSFLAEYLLLKKPAVYTSNQQDMRAFYNAFGKEALEAHYIAKSVEEIDLFLDRIINNNIKIKPEHINFINKHQTFYSTSNLPSDAIIKEIKQSFLKT